MRMKTISGNYKICVGNYDWGAAVDKVVVTLEEFISQIDAEQIKVTEHKMVTEEETPEYDIHEEYIERNVLSAYLCDEQGEVAEGPSRYLALDLQVGPVTGSPLVCHGRHGIFRWSNPYELLIEGPGLKIAKEYTEKTTAADMFTKHSYVSSQGVEYKYAAYSPGKETDLLFVWLHGLGEGQEEGSDAYLPLVGHKGTTLAGDTFQNLLGGAHILVPQCPTYWMDKDGKATNFADKRIMATASSYYCESLEELIDAFAEEKGCKRVAVGGCSNGGFMSLILGMNRPERYLAAVPICEAVPDSSITEEQIKALTKIPLYFIYCIKDPIVDPQVHEIPTIRRLKEAGHKNLMVYESKQVIDTTGNYKKEDGTPHEYMAHLSWIHFDNNETENGEKLGVWEWLRDRVEK